MGVQPEIVHRRYCASFKSSPDSNLYLDDQCYGHHQHGAWYDTDVCGTASCDAYTYICPDSDPLPDSDAYTYSYVMISAQKEDH
jgi:hypothetical protein